MSDVPSDWENNESSAITSQQYESLYGAEAALPGAVVQLYLYVTGNIPVPLSGASRHGRGSDRDVVGGQPVEIIPVVRSVFNR